MLPPTLKRRVTDIKSETDFINKSEGLTYRWPRASVVQLGVYSTFEGYNEGELGEKEDNIPH